MSQLFYLQDSRSYVGNDVLWWAHAGGYTTDLSKAALFGVDAAQARHFERVTDIPWPKAYIDSKVRPAVDMQYIDRDVALKGTGIEIVKPTKPRHDTRCHGCNRFIRKAELYGACPHCGADNWP